MSGTCPVCKRTVEVHREGWSYDHTATGSLDDDLCPGSGQPVEHPSA